MVDCSQEAMFLGSATIASNKTGSGIALINSDTIGLLFKPEDKTSLFEFLNYLLINREAINELGQAVYYTMQIQGNSQVATKRLVQLFNSLSNNIVHPIFENRPSSKP
jgi:glycosyltransferase involved in cell wall biosynthesis